MATTNILTEVENDMDNAILHLKGWRIKWKGQYIGARGKWCWFNQGGARQAFHAEYGYLLSGAILEADGKPTPDRHYRQTDAPLAERNHLIDRLIEAKLLEFIKT